MRSSLSRSHGNRANEQSKDIETKNIRIYSWGMGCFFCEILRFHIVLLETVVLNYYGTDISLGHNTSAMANNDFRVVFKSLFSI